MVALLPAFHVLAVFCTLAFAAPASHLASRHAHPHTHHVRSLPNGLQLRSYHTPSSFELFNRGIDHPLSKRAGTSPIREVGMAYINQRLGSEAVWQSTLNRGNASTSHVYAHQEINGVVVANTVANVALSTGNKVTAFSSNFVSSANAPSAKPKISAAAAANAALTTLSGKSVGTEPLLHYYPLENEKLALTYATDLTLENRHLVRAFVDTETSQVVGMFDYTNELSFRVSPITSHDPSKDYELLVDPENLDSSPEGWNTFNGNDTNSTIGNNAVAFIGDENGIGGQSAPGVFDFNLQLNSDPRQGENQNAALTNAFFVANTVHDIFYQYGFTEAAFNFQQSNFGKGGAEDDAVQISVQDGSGTDNAQFTTPPDGQPGQMEMFLFVATDPIKDGAMTNDVVAHEYVHGVSNRLTGGGTADCLQTLESGGLGEGWSDAVADWLTQQSGQVVDFKVGEFLFPGGIRSFPYSLDRSVNPLTFSQVAQIQEVHDIGTVWAQTLHIVNAALIQAKGFSNDSFTNPAGTGGNTIWLHLFTDALALQPCNPTFLDARAAWIQADVDRFNGDNHCTLWTAFASMGLGPDASNGVDDFAVPVSCGGTASETASTGTGSGNGAGNGNGSSGGRNRNTQGFLARHKHQADVAN